MNLNCKGIVYAKEDVIAYSSVRNIKIRDTLIFGEAKAKDFVAYTNKTKVKAPDLLIEGSLICTKDVIATII